MVKVALVSCREMGGLDDEDSPLPGALGAANLEPELTFWDDPGVRWESFGAVVLRSPWDYFKRYPEFLAWLERVERAAPLFNPAPVVRWNSHKQYLTELEARGVAIVPTVLLRRGGPVQVAQLASSRGWTDGVLKPAVAAGGFRTLRHPDLRAPKAQHHADELLRDVDVLLQPYQAAVASQRERSLIFIDGKLSHAITKSSVFEPPTAAQVQLPNGAYRSEIQGLTPAADELALAQKTLAAAPGAPLLYARVDMIRGEDGVIRLMELEAFEPSLYFRHFPASARMFAEAVARRVR